MGAVDVKHSDEQELTMEWESSSNNDMIADSCLALILGIDHSPASAKLTSHSSSHVHVHADAEDGADMKRIQRIALFLEAHFGDVELHMPEEPRTGETDGEIDDEPSFIIRLDDAEARINLISLTVESNQEQLKKRIENVLDVAISTISSLSESYSAGGTLISGDVQQGALTTTETAEALPPVKEDPEDEGGADPKGANTGAKSGEAEESDDESILEVHD